MGVFTSSEPYANKAELKTSYSVNSYDRIIWAVCYVDNFDLKSRFKTIFSEELTSQSLHPSATKVSDWTGSYILVALHNPKGRQVTIEAGASIGLVVSDKDPDPIIITK